MMWWLKWKAYSPSLIWMILAPSMAAVAIVLMPSVQALHGWLVVPGTALVSLSSVWCAARLIRRGYVGHDKTVARRLVCIGSAVALLSALSLLASAQSLSVAPAVSARDISQAAYLHELSVLGSGNEDTWSYPYHLQDRTPPSLRAFGTWSVSGTSMSLSRYQIHASFRHSLLCERSLPFFPQAHLRAVHGVSWTSDAVPRTDAEIRHACSGGSLTFVYDRETRSHADQ